MLRLDRITLHNFKSFRHANINFSKGFNCIVGPNGSGKSNICDALLFAMGESSLKRMRVSSAKGLINAMAKPVKSDGVRRAYTTVAFTGDENIEISRIIKSNNKISYRINGKRSTRQQVLDLLKAHKAELNETNTIIQGEITKILNLSARERRSLIDIAAGISEFDEKREAAQKELEKVDAKINEANIMLGERQAFLNELEKEKSDAERYLELQAKIKKTTYTMLKAREEQISGEYKNVVEGYDRLTNRRKSLEAEIKKLDDELSSVTSYKEKLVKKMNEGSIELSTANKMLDETSSNIRIQENLIRQIEESIANGKERIKGLKEESESITKKLDSNAAEMAMLKSALASAEKELAKHAIDEHSSGKEIIARYSELQKELLGIEGVLSDINSECISRNSELSKLQDGLSAANSEIERMEAERKALDESYKKLQKELKAELDKLQAGRGRLQDINAKIGEQNIAASKFDTELINLREQLALSGKSQDRITPRLSDIESRAEERVLWKGVRASEVR
ncbi:MAG: AAA family ATPase [Candidatus Marsarchaeota archaeon]|nr:AAA family ATPase [Candidatus Marsarchaeota archaeon]